MTYDLHELSEKETTRRAKEALRRAFKNPPQPRKPIGKKGEKSDKSASMLRGDKRKPT
jgi:hypothetical protein